MRIFQPSLQYVTQSMASSSSYGTKAQLFAGDIHGFGDAVYMNSDGHARIGNATVVATSYCVGISTQTVAATGSAEYLLHGVIRKSGWGFTAGQPVYLSATGTSGNTLTQTQPTGTDKVIQILGVAITSDTLFFNPQLVQVELV